MKTFNRHLKETENDHTQNSGGKKMKAKELILGLVALSVLLFATPATAGVPQMINYQGVLTDTDGCPVDDGDYDMVFRIYNAVTGGDSLWGESHSSVSVTQGNFNVSLGGSGNPIPSSIFLNDSLWLDVEVEEEKMTPRQRIASVGYAFRSEFADTADHCWTISDGDWTIDGDNIYREQGNVGIGTAGPEHELHVVAPNQLGLRVDGPRSGTGSSLVLQTTGTGGRGWEILATGSGAAQGADKLNIRDLDDASDDVTITSEGHVGIGTTSPVAKLQVDAGAGKAIRAESEGDSGSKMGGQFHANGAGNSNVGVIARGGCYGLCTPASYCNIGIYAKDGSDGTMDVLPGGSWAGYFKGDVKMTDSLHVGGNATIDDDLSVAGTIKLTFDYDTTFSINTNQTKTVDHDLGGDASEYIVFMDGISSNGGIHQSDFGTACFLSGVTQKCVGCEWFGLTNTQIKVFRAAEDDDMSPDKDWDECRIRILKNQ